MVDAAAGREMADQVASGDFIPPCYLLLGMRGIEASDGQVTLAIGTSPWLCQAFGVIYGGAIAYLADATMIIGAGGTVPAGTAFNTIDLKINFLRPVLPGSGEVQATARVVHRGRTIALVNCDIVDAAGKLVAQATSSVLLLPGRFWEKPVQVATEIQADAE
ncbi:MAG TPA: PaaI family thioesterase [Candidatus Dormibacteraeota bacterium]|nr:PaaI family thioesterase [Candidatus Dormibacteraeota bacterium]